MSHLKSRVEPGWGMRKDKGKENGMLKKIEKKEGSPEREGDSTCPPEVNSSWTERKFNGKKKISGLDHPLNFMRTSSESKFSF